MTTDLRIILSEDVFVENDGLIFSGSSSYMTKLAALTYVAEVKGNLRQERLDCLGIVIRRVAEVLPHYRLWLLASQGAWQPDTARMRSLKLWRWLASAGKKTPTRVVGPEIARFDARGLRWFAVAEVSVAEIPAVHDILLTEKPSFLVAAPEPPDLEAYLAAGWAEGHPGVMTFWRDMALVAAQEHHLLFRSFGNFDDPEIGVNVIGAPETIAMLEGTDSTRQLV